MERVLKYVARFLVMDTKRDLLEQLARHAYQFRPEEPFVLASGAKSDEYLDCKLALSQPRAMAALGKVILQILHPKSVAIGGLTMGADPIAMSTCQASAGGAREVRWFTVRKEPKVHGQKKLIEGSAQPRESVTIVDDVVTSGSSTVQAIDRCREFGLEIVQVIVLVDRQQLDGLANIRRSAGAAQVVAVFTKDQVKQQWLSDQARARGITIPPCESTDAAAKAASPSEG